MQSKLVAPPGTITRRTRTISSEEGTPVFAECCAEISGSIAGVRTSRVRFAGFRSTSPRDSSPPIRVREVLRLAGSGVKYREFADRLKAPGARGVRRPREGLRESGVDPVRCGWQKTLCAARVAAKGAVAIRSYRLTRKYKAFSLVSEATRAAALLEREELLAAEARHLPASHRRRSEIEEELSEIHRLLEGLGFRNKT
jgi:hypothetical protein